MLQWSKCSPNASHSLEKKFGYWVRKFVNTQTFHFPVLHASACQHFLNISITSTERRLVQCSWRCQCGTIFSLYLLTKIFRLS
jgi:hypothetical protein